MGIAGEVVDKVKKMHESGEEGKAWPELWEAGYDIGVFLEMPLHLIFHGVLAVVVEAMHEFLKDHQLLSKFEERVNGALWEIIQLKLELCKAKVLSKNCGLA